MPPAPSPARYCRRAGGYSAAPPHSVRNQQTEPRFEPDALLAGERHTVGFGGHIVIGSGKSDGHDLAFPYRPGPECRRMFLVGHCALPFAVGAGVGPERIEKRVTAAQRAIAHDHNALIATLNRIEHLDDD